MPDYQFAFEGLQLLFEVTGFNVKPSRGFAYVDSLPMLREKINKAYRQIQRGEGLFL